jgi:hypothetical protein
MRLRPALYLNRAALAPAAGVSYETEASDLFTRMASAGSEPDTARKGHINTLIAALKTAGVWTLLDVFYVMAAHAESVSLLNWITNDFNGVAPAAGFTTDRGWIGNGTDRVIDTGYTPSTEGTNYLQNGAHIAVYSRTNATNANYLDVGLMSAAASDNLRVNIRGAADDYRARINTASGTDAFDTGNQTDSRGHFIVNRTASTATDAYRNGAKIGATSATASGTVPSGNIALLGSQESSIYSARELASFSAGGQLNATKVGDYYTAVQAYMTAVGANV